MRVYKVTIYLIINKIVYSVKIRYYLLEALKSISWQEMVTKQFLKSNKIKYFSEFKNQIKERIPERKDKP